MASSLRRIANTLTICGIIALTVGTIYGITQFCGYGSTNCLLASVGFTQTPELALELPASEVSGSSPAVLPASSPLWTTVFSVVQLTGVYVVIVGLFALLVLEFFELHYIRQVRTLLRRQLKNAL